MSHAALPHTTWSQTRTHTHTQTPLPPVHTHTHNVVAHTHTHTHAQTIITHTAVLITDDAITPSLAARGAHCHTQARAPHCHTKLSPAATFLAASFS